MDIVLLSVRLGLAIVFVIAGVAKLADRTGSRHSLQAFGLPERLIPAAALALPVLEITIALGLLPASTAWLASIGVVVLLAGFVAGFAYNLARGRRPDGHCFGQLYSKPIGFETLLRNGLLAALAAVAVNAGPSGTGPSAVAWLFDLRPDTLLLGGAVIPRTVISMIQAWFLIQLFRQHGRLLLRVETAGLPAPVAAPAPALELMTLDGPNADLARGIRCQPVGEVRRQHDRGAGCACARDHRSANRLRSLHPNASNSVGSGSQARRAVSGEAQTSVRSGLQEAPGQSETHFPVRYGHV